MNNVVLRLPFLLALGILSIAARAQNIPNCYVSSGPTQCTTQCSCSPSNGWAPTIPAANCEHLTLHCANIPNGVSINDLGLTIGYQTPPTGTKAVGTIVFLSPEGGNSPSSDNASCPFPPCYTDVKYFGDYLGANYQVVQAAWDSNLAWEDTGTTTKNIAYAAGRVAGFLSWVKTNLYQPIFNANPNAGMCAQGNSAGGGAIAYDLAWYGGYLDHAEFLSSPPLSNLQAGCEVFVGSSLDITVCPPGQYGCNPANNPASWTLSPYYERRPQRHQKVDRGCQW